MAKQIVSNKRKLYRPILKDKQKIKQKKEKNQEIGKKNSESAVTRIRTWVIAATTQCTNHYTITAATSTHVHFWWNF